MTWITPSLNCKYPFVHVHTSHRSYGYSPLTLCSWQQTQNNSWCNLWHLCWHHVKCWLSYGMKTITCTLFNHIQFLSLMNWHCVHKKWQSHFNWHYHCQPNMIEFASPILHNSRIHNVAHKKKKKFNQHPTNQFFPLAIEVFGCLNKQADVFSNKCVNAIWSLKWLETLPLSILVTFFQ